jgi:hypothetical protein
LRSRSVSECPYKLRWLEVDLTLGWGILDPTPKRGERGDPYRELQGESILRNIPIIR